MTPPRWTAHDVTGADLAAHTIRTYLEQAEVRRYLLDIRSRIRVDAACDIGAGYGRMTPLLGEVASRVVAYEREPALAEMGQGLLPQVEFLSVDRLSRLPVPDQTFDVALVFTVLQHLSDEESRATATEIGRVLKPGGYALVCEETDPLHRWREPGDGDGRCTVGRAVGTYAEMLPLDLIATSPRRVEPTYPRPDVGSYMLFGR